MKSACLLSTVSLNPSFYWRHFPLEPLDKSLVDDLIDVHARDHRIALAQKILDHPDPGDGRCRNFLENLRVAAEGFFECFRIVYLQEPRQAAHGQLAVRLEKPQRACDRSHHAIEILIAPLQ